jgi:hypothetical protein
VDGAVAFTGEEELGGVHVKVNVEVGGQDFELAIAEILEMGRSPLQVVVVYFPA